MMVILLLLACGGGSGLGRPALWDLDGDGVPVPFDCDDADDTVGMPTDVFTDQDGDGYGDPATASPTCTPGDGVTFGNDCDDANPEVSPSADEICNNGVDDNCDDDPAPCTPSGTVQAERSDARLSGTEIDERFGRDIDVVPDLDGDGDDELVVGASGLDSTDSGAGAVYLFRGPLTGPRDSTGADASLWGDERNGDAGIYVEAAGDVDGDGEGDLVITCYPASDYTGHVHVELGPFSGERELGGITLTGEMYDYIYPIAAGLDVDGSGGRDFVVASPGWDDTASMSRDWGAVFVFTDAPPSGDAADVANLSILGTDDNERFGRAVGGGDLDGDGDDDLAISSDRYGTDVGAIWFVYDLSGDTIDVGDLTDMREGVVEYGFAGVAVSVFGDMDDDGYADVALASNEDTVGANAGAVYVLKGPVTGAGTLATADATLYPAADMSQAGSEMTAAGDINADGRADLLIGGDATAGEAWLFFGPIGGTGALADADLLIKGDTSGNFSLGLGGGGDVSGDGGDDLMVAAWSADPAGVEDAGEVYLLFGGGW